jgi:dTDP-4-amino-4,6-dideoxygalactose transaminase
MADMRINANDLKRQYEMYKDAYEEAALRTLRSGWYVLGNEVRAFEDEFADYLGAKYCVGLASGLDALTLAFRALGVGEGDEVIVASNAYIACVMGITMNGATPVFVEPDADYVMDASQIDRVVTDRTKAILAVHLYGRACDMTRISQIAKQKGLFVVEDCAQAHGTEWEGEKVGTFGDVGCFSFYPTKGLGCFGDGGAITTRREDIAARIRQLRNYGSSQKYVFAEVGVNSRLDELQAALLRVKLRHLDELNHERRQIANRYIAEIVNEKIVLPNATAGHTWHQFVVRTSDRDALKAYLQEQDIGTEIHYPIPPHLSEAYAYLGYTKGAFPVAEQFADEVLSLPMYNGYSSEEQSYVIDALNRF